MSMKKLSWILMAIFFSAFIGYIGKVCNCEAAEQESETLCRDPFYLSHKEECRAIAACYLAKEEVDCYKNPNSEVKLAPIDKGTKIMVYFTYQKEGDIWGVIHTINNRDTSLVRERGWVKLRNLEFQEDIYSFISQYIGEIDNMDEGNLFDGVRSHIQKDIVMWFYPCSGKIVGTLSKENYPSEEKISGRLSYQDKQGRYWIFYMDYQTEEGYQDFALCLSDPENDSIKKEVSIQRPDITGKCSKLPVVIQIGIAIGLVICVLVIYKVISKFVSANRE